MSFNCPECGQTIHDTDWATNNVIQSQIGLAHVVCPTHINQENKQNDDSNLQSMGQQQHMQCKKERDELKRKYDELEQKFHIQKAQMQQIYDQQQDSLMQMVQAKTRESQSNESWQNKYKSLHASHAETKQKLQEKEQTINRMKQKQKEKDQTISRMKQEQQEKEQIIKQLRHIIDANDKQRQKWSQGVDEQRKYDAKTSDIRDPEKEKTLEDLRTILDTNNKDRQKWRKLAEEEQMRNAELLSQNEQIEAENKELKLLNEEHNGCEEIMNGQKEKILRWKELINRLKTENHNLHEQIKEGLASAPCDVECEMDQDTMLRRIKSVQTNEEINKLLREKFDLEEENGNLQRKIDQYIKQIEKFTKGKMAVLSDDTEDKEDTKEEANDHNLVPCNSKLCNKLQENLESYIKDQPKDAMIMKDRKKKGMDNENSKVILFDDVLRIFHKTQEQIIRDWEDGLGSNAFWTVSEELLAIFKDDYEDDDDVDPERLVHKILFSTIVECYNLLYAEYYKIKDNEHVNWTVIDMVLLNVNVFYKFVKLQQNMKLKDTWKARLQKIGVICKFIKGRIDAIYTQIEKKYPKYMDDDAKMLLCPFIADCCEVIWGILHYGFEIYPLSYAVNNERTEYDYTIHARKCENMGVYIKYYIFPAIRSHKVYETKVWVICN